MENTVFSNLLSNKKSLLAVIGLVIVLTAIPITYFLTQRTQDLRQRAAEGDYCGTEIRACVNIYNGDTRISRTGACASTETALSWGDGGKLGTLIHGCTNRYNGDLRISRKGARTEIQCASTETPISWSQGDISNTRNAITSCVNIYNGDVRILLRGSTCASTETQLLWSKNTLAQCKLTPTPTNRTSPTPTGGIGEQPTPSPTLGRTSPTPTKTPPTPTPTSSSRTTPTPTLSPNCKTGANSVSVTTFCERGGATAATYVCYDGFSGTVTSPECIDGIKFKALADQACAGRIVCYTPTPRLTITPTPTGGIGGQPTPTPTTKARTTLTPTLTKSPSPTPTTQRTPTPTPTTIPSTTPQAGEGVTVFQLDMPGIGTATGDNSSPLNSPRSAKIQVFNTQNAKVAEKDLQVQFQGDVYRGSTSLAIPQGNYYAKVSLNNTLFSDVPGVFVLTHNQSTTLPATVMIPGDLDQNNILDLRDYNIFIGCYGNKQCTQKALADLNDDGSVGPIDYNILLRSFAIRQGT